MLMSDMTHITVKTPTSVKDIPALFLAFGYGETGRQNLEPQRKHRAPPLY